MWIILSIVLVFSIGDTTWSSKFCNVDGSCEYLSSGYKQPYCEQWGNGNACTRLSLTNNLSSIRDNQVDKNASLDSMSMQDLINNYCSSLLWGMGSWRVYFARPNNESDKQNMWDWQQTFDSHQSIFVNALCSSFKLWDNSPFIENKSFMNVFKKWDIVDILKLKQSSWWKDNCSLIDSNGLQDCDMAIYATKIYSTIMSDIFKIKYAQVLNVDTYENFDADKKVESFLSWYFNYMEKDPGKDFKQTVSVLKSNQKYYRNALNSVKFIDNTEMAYDAFGSGCPEVGYIAWKNFIACALHSSQWNGSALTPSFVTMIYNEILNYRIFVLYVDYWTKAKSKNLGEAQKMEYELKSLDLQKYAALQIKATMGALHTFEDFNMTYPLHIWLLLYQERMKNFRDKKLAPVITIFYSLSEKLQNVQLPN